MLKDLELERIEDLSDTEAELITGGTLTLPSALQHYWTRPTTGYTKPSGGSWVSLNPQPEPPG
jgi:hypothetical protein